MIKTFLFIGCLSFSTALFAQNFEWARTYGASSSDIGTSVTVDATGNIYTTGYFLGTVDFDPGIGIFELTSVNGYSAFVQKMDANGNFIWAKTFNGNSFGYAIRIDAAGNVFTTGYFTETVDFDPGTGTSELIAIGSSDAFVQKMDAAGNFIWAKSFGGIDVDRAFSIDLDASGNVYTTGYYLSAADFDPGVGVTEFTSVGSADIFVQKMDNDGNFLWARSFGGSGNDGANAIKVDIDGNVITTGYFLGTADFDPGVGTSELISNGSLDVFVQKMDEDGNFLWAKSFGSTSFDGGNSISLDVSGNIYTTGTFSGGADFDPGTGTTTLTPFGSDDVFVQKMDADGNFQWARSFGGAWSDYGFSVSTDNAGNVYTTGAFQETVDFDPGPGTASLTSAGGDDVYVQKMDTDGSFLWAVSFGGSSGDLGYAIAIATNGNVITTGSFSGSVDFDPGSGASNLMSQGSDDIFVQKLNQSAAGMVEMNLDVQITAFPNPTDGNVQITSDRELKNVHVSIIDVNGKEVYTKHFDCISNEQINFDGKSGIYYLHIATPEFQRVLKLVKYE